MQRQKCNKNRPEDVSFRPVFTELLRKMYMVVNVVYAEAVVALAAGAEAKLEIWEVLVRPAADLAFAVVGLGCLAAVVLLGSVFEVDGVFLLLYPGGPDVVKEPAAAEQQVVEDGHDGQQVDGEGVYQNGIYKDDRVQNAQPFYLYGNDEEQQYIGVRKEGCKGEEHGQVEVVAVKADIYPSDEPQQNAVYDIEQHSAEIIYGELALAPLGLKGAAHEVVEVYGQEQRERTAAAWNEHEGYEPPYLAFSKNKFCIKGYGRNKGVACIHEAENPDKDVSGHYIEHEVSDSKTGMGQTETVNFPHQTLHCKTSKTKAEIGMSQ